LVWQISRFQSSIPRRWWDEEEESDDDDFFVVGAVLEGLKRKKLSHSEIPFSKKKLKIFKRIYLFSFKMICFEFIFNIK
jgi:hypothetical protein